MKKFTLKLLLLLTCGLSTVFTGCQSKAGEGSITTNNLASPVNSGVYSENFTALSGDNAVYYIDNGIMRYDFATNTATKIISDTNENIIFLDVYSFEKYLIYETADKSDDENYDVKLCYADKENDFAIGCLYTSDDYFNLNTEGDDLYVYTNDYYYESKGALQDISLISQEKKENEVTTGTSDTLQSEPVTGSITLNDGSTLNLSITGTQLVYKLAGDARELKVHRASYLDRVDLSDIRFFETDEKIAILLTNADFGAWRQQYSLINNSAFKDDLLIEINKADLSGKFLYESKSPKNRVIGYDGLAYIYKKGAIYSTADGKELTKICDLELNMDHDYQFTWIDSHLVVFDATAKEVVLAQEIN